MDILTNGGHLTLLFRHFIAAIADSPLFQKCISFFCWRQQRNPVQIQVSISTHLHNLIRCKPLLKIGFQRGDRFPDSLGMNIEPRYNHGGPGGMAMATFVRTYKISWPLSM